MSKLDTNLSNILNIDPEPKEILAPYDPASPREAIVNMDDADKDFQKARQNIKELINLGFIAIDGVMKVASEGDSPRAYEVVAQMLKAVADTNKDLINLHQCMKALKQEKYLPNTINNTTNSIFLGSTKELQELINPKRSFAKALIDSTIIIDDTKKILENG